MKFYQCIKFQINSFRSLDYWISIFSMAYWGFFARFMGMQKQKTECLSVVTFLSPIPLPFSIPFPFPFHVYSTVTHGSGRPSWSVQNDFISFLHRRSEVKRASAAFYARSSGCEILAAKRCVVATWTEWEQCSSCLWQLLVSLPANSLLAPDT